MITILVLLLIWQGVTMIFSIPNYFLPSPLAVMSVFFIKFELIMKHSVTTTVEALIGFALGVSFAFTAAVAFYYSKIIKKILYPVMLAFNVVPKLALAPLFLIWFGHGLMPKIVIAALISFFPVLVNTVTGFKSIEYNLIDLMRSLNATKTQILIKLAIPNSAVHIFSGLKLSATLSVVGAIVAEFVGAESGLGHLVLISEINLETELIFASIIAVTIIGSAFFELVCYIEKKVIYWHR